MMIFSKTNNVNFSKYFFTIGFLWSHSFCQVVQSTHNSVCCCWRIDCKEDVNHHYECDDKNRTYMENYTTFLSRIHVFAFSVLTPLPATRRTAILLKLEIELILSFMTGFSQAEFLPAIISPHYFYISLSKHINLPIFYSIHNLLKIVAKRCL